MKPGARTKAMDSESLADECAQAEFLDDIQASFKEMKAGKVLPAEDALKLIELGLDDDELKSRLPQ